MTDLPTIVKRLQEDFSRTITSQTAEEQGRLLAIIEDLHAVTKERVRDLCREEIKKMIHKLKNGLELDPGDIDKIKLWVIGDEGEFEKTEHHCRVWENELETILAEIQPLRDSRGTLLDYMTFQALLRRASVVLGDIFYCRRQRESLSRFQEIGSGVTPAQRAFLIKILEDKLNSGDG